jgi:hypothetical protein
VSAYAAVPGTVCSKGFMPGITRAARPVSDCPCVHDRTVSGGHVTSLQLHWACFSIPSQSHLSWHIRHSAQTYTLREHERTLDSVSLVDGLA